ncbi:MAG: hypothetical protein DHS20C19_13380 [Acidimicrobiales bacterium]|nr:MAG: hypothetical protein DHS20C19_13380 [Acidimicrobiales bacterium]
MEEFFETLGDETRERRAPSVKGAITAAAAVLAWIGLMAIAVDNIEPDSTNVIGIFLGLLAAAVGHGIIVALNPEVRPAGVALIALGTVQALGFMFDDLDSPTALLFLLVLAYAAQWAFGPARGAMTLLTLALLAGWAFVVDIAAGDPDGGTVRDGSVFLDDSFVNVPDSSFTRGDDTVAYLSLLIGAGLLLAVRALDRRGWRGIATSAVIVGDIAFVVGVFGVLGTFESDSGGSMLVLAAGIVLALCAAPGGRRFSTWLGGIGVFAGLVALITTTMEPDSAVQFGLVCLLVGGAIVVAGAYIDLDSMRDNQPVEAATNWSPPDTAPATAPDPAAAPAAAPATEGWHPDPSGRHELRYHDGSAWTAHVSDAGATSTDEGP